MTAHAWILGAGETALGVVRCLGPTGIHTTVFDGGRGIAMRSRHARAVVIPETARVGEELVQFLARYLAMSPVPPVVFPTTDAWARTLAEVADRFGARWHPAVPSLDAVSLLLDKDTFAREGMARGWSVPRRIAPEEVATLNAGAYPIAAKPRARRAGADLPDKVRDRRLEELRLVPLASPDDAARFLATEQDLLPWLAFQEFIPGDSSAMVTVGVAADREGRPLRIFTGRKVRGYPAAHGDCIVGEATSVPEAATAEAIAITRELRLCGVCEFEFKLEPHTGAPRLIEINPRPWSWIELTPHVGRNLPLAVVEGLRGGTHTTAAPASQPPATFVRGLRDGWNVLARYRRDGDGWPMSATSWYADLAARRPLVLAERTDNDPAPAIAMVASQLGTLLGKELRRAVTGAPILLYHAVLPRVPEEMRAAVHNVSPAHFEAQLVALARRYRIRTLDEVASAPDPRGLAAVTFDDGYRSVFAEALPVLERLGIPATVFVCGEWLAGIPSWREQLRAIVGAGLAPAFVAATGGRFTRDPSSLMRATKDPRIPTNAVRSALTAFAASHGLVASRHAEGPLTRDALPIHPLLTYGNHSWGHAVLSSLSTTEAGAEIVRGRDAIADLPTASRSGAFAVPFGERRHWTTETLALAAASGHSAVVLAGGRVNRVPELRSGVPVLDRILPPDRPGLERELLRRGLKGRPLL